jgi:hypothetical protein
VQRMEGRGFATRDLSDIEPAQVCTLTPQSHTPSLPKHGLRCLQCNDLVGFPTTL